MAIEPSVALHHERHEESKQHSVQMWLMGASAANFYLQSLWVVQAAFLSRVWNLGSVVCVCLSLTILCALHLFEVACARMSLALGVAVSFMFAILAMSIAASLAIDRIFALRRGRLSIHLVVFFMTHTKYIYTYCAAHFGRSFVPMLVLGVCAVAVLWEVMRRLIRKPPPVCSVFATGVLGGIVASFAFPTLPAYSGDQQATLAGDILTEVLRPVTKAMKVDRHTVTKSKSNSSMFGLPHVVMFHIEAARPDILGNQTTPFLASFQNGPRARLHSVFATVPMTLKSAWEVLCGTVPSLSADFREHQHEEFRMFCLPRILRGLGYRTLCAKTDLHNNELPRTVFGFDDVIAEEDPRRLIDLIEKWVVVQTSNKQPIFIYFYYSGSHAPYLPANLANRNQYSVVVRQFHEDPTWNTYMNMVHRGDRCVEHLKRTLEARGICSSESLWFVFGDHSENLPGDSAGPWRWYRRVMRGASVRLDHVQTFVAVQLPTWIHPPGPCKSARRFADLHATVLEVVGLKAIGPLFFGISLCQAVLTPRTFFSYMWLDNSQCAKRQHGITQVLGPRGVHLYNTSLDPRETTGLHIGHSSSAERDCFNHLYAINDYYRRSLPNVALHDLKPSSRTRLHVRSAMDIVLTLSSHESDGTMQPRGVLPPYAEAFFINATGMWEASDTKGHVQKFNAFDCFVVVDLQLHLPRAYANTQENASGSCTDH